MAATDERLSRGAVMGHSNIATTQKYLHVDEADMTAAVQAIGQMKLVVNAENLNVQPPKIITPIHSVGG